MKVATREEGDPRAVLSLCRASPFSPGGEETDRILVVRFLRLFSYLIFLPPKNKALLYNSGVKFSLEAKKLSNV